MADGYGVLDDELRAHAGRLDGLHEQLATALAAAQQVSLGDQAFGQICQFFVPIVHAVSTPGVQALTTSAASVQETADGVRDTATTYEQTEQGNTQTLTPGGN
jgi:uncharacterized protein YukE